MIDFETVNKYFIYNPETGVIVNRIVRGGVNAGKVSGRIMPESGYRQIGIEGKIYLAHRLAWLLTHKKWPEFDIDHINHIRDDNRIENLRDVTRKENCKNIRLLDSNTSRVTGIHRDQGKWRVRIMGEGKRINLGVYEDWFDAVCARKSADIKYGYHKNHGIVI